jgi:hypothetical protein
MSLLDYNLLNSTSWVIENMSKNENCLKELRQMEIAILMRMRDMAISSPRILKGVFGYCDETVKTLSNITNTQLLQLNDTENNLPILTLRSKNEGIKRLIESLPSSPLASLELDRMAIA